MSKVCLQVVLTGTVQGVGFRQAAVREAENLDVTGWVRNQDDGSVSALVCGTTEAVEKMVNWLAKGPEGATVNQCAANSCAWQDIAGFTQL